MSDLDPKNMPGRDLTLAFLVGGRSWPRATLSMKNLSDCTHPRFGFSSTGGSSVITMEGGGSLRYASVEELLDAGWRVD